MPITQYCDEHQLTPRGRLELFVPVCHAVQHAHQKGIIHRDIKPTNVLVAEYDDRAVPKIIDFGVAKAVQQQLTEKTMFTQFGQIVGTVDYMSPEQAKLNELDIDTRSDVYSLGVLLYELLTGETPIDRARLRSAAFDELLRIIREEEPPKPSTRLSSLETAGTVSAHRKMDPKRLGQLVRGDLDWITMKALEKDRTRRYETANGLADDVRRYLDDEPVVACPPSPVYRFRRFARRNKALLATIALVAAVLLLGVVVSTWQAIRAHDHWINEREARQTADNLRVVAQRETERAKEAAAQEAEARQASQQSERQARRHLYAAHMNLVRHAWDVADIRNLLELLDRHRPQPGQDDLRGFEWYYWWRLVHDNRLTLTHDGLIHCVVVSPDGKTLASACADGTVQLWDSATGKRTRTFAGAKEQVQCLAFSPNGKLLAAGYGRFNQPGELRIWDATTGKLTATLGKDGDSVQAVAFSPDGKIVASGGYDHGTLWDVAKEEIKHSFEAPALSMMCVAFAPDGTNLASGAQNGKLQLWDSETGELRKTLEAHTATVSSVAFSLDGKRLASASVDRTVKTWSSATGDLEATLEEQEAVRSVAFSPDGLCLATASDARTVKLWDVASGIRKTTLRGHTVPVASVAFFPDGMTLASGGQDGTVKLWDVATSQTTPICEGHPGYVASVAFSPDGNTLASADSGRSSDGGPSHGTRKADCTVKLWDPATGQLKATLSDWGTAQEPASGTGSWAKGVLAIGFSPDGKTLAAGRLQDRAVTLWDIPSGQTKATLEGHDDSIQTVAFLPDGKILASGSSDRTVKLWNVVTGQVKATLQGHSDAVLCVVFSPDGRTLASACADGAVKLWDPVSGQVKAALEAHPQHVLSLAFSPDGSTLASGSRDRTVKLWDSATGHLQKTLRGHARSVLSVAFAPDGMTLASASADHTVKLWDPATGEPKATLGGHSHWVSSVAFSPDGKTLASGSDDHTIRLWRAATKEDVLRDESSRL